MTDYTLKKIDSELWYKVKTLALKRRTSIKGLIIDLLKQEIEKEEKK